MNNMSNWVWVSGGAHRLGREICLAFARSGWSVVVHCHRSPTEAQAVADQCRALGVQAFCSLAYGATASHFVDVVQKSKMIQEDIRCQKTNAVCVKKIK